MYRKSNVFGEFVEADKDFELIDYEHHPHIPAPVAI